MLCQGKDMSHVNTPNFKTLSLEDRPIIEKYISAYKPYSDFNFFSLWGYMNNKCQWSIVHDNLALILVDYLTQKRFLTFIGTSEVSRTTTDLLSLAQTLKVDPILKLVPKDTVDADPSLSELFDVKKDMDSADYILDIGLLSSMSGKYYANKRHELNRFLKTYSDYKIMITTVDKHREHIESVFDQWTLTRTDHDWRHEHTALMKVLNQKEIPYLLYAFEVNSKPAGFAIIEELKDNYAMLHYWKADKSLTNAYSFLMHSVAQDLFTKGYKYLNFQQDLGLDYLRESKPRWHPVFFLEKFTITRHGL